ncbi:MAG: nuclear transport factor 2 family protein, partial [bacterium]|nr:nuclear transport factor 2 family protein [Candidatus Kapabacteria bacterium]
MTPAQIVQRQLDAYDTGDIDAFLATYTDDIAVYDHPSTLLMRGHDAMRETYSKLFASAPDLKTHISQRIEHGNFVVDYETVTGVPGGGTRSVIAMYQVR